MIALLIRAWIGVLVVGLSLGCSGGGATNDGGAGSGGGAVGGRGGQAGGGAGRGGGAAGQAGGAAGQAGGASGQGGTAGAGGRGGGAGSADGGFSGCAMLAGLSFDSLDERECGLAPPDSGAALCHWRITFTDAVTFTWRHSDYVESGSYSCSANAITAQTQTRGALTAILDPTIWRFTWDGVVYACAGCPP